MKSKFQTISADQAKPGVAYFVVCSRDPRFRYGIVEKFGSYWRGASDEPVMIGTFFGLTVMELGEI